MSRFSIFFVLLALFFIYANMATAQMVEDGLIAYWSFDEKTISGKDVKDVIGGNHGVLNGNPKSVPGKVGGALQFDGTNSVDVEGTEDLNFNGKDEMTVMAWVNSGDDDDPVQGIVAGCCGTIVAQRDATSWALRYDGRNPGTEIEFIVQPGWQGDGGFGVSKFPKGEWHHIVAIVDSNKVYIYVDGEMAIEGNYSGPMSSVSSEVDIGHASDGGFIGIIDEVAIYNRALSADEIKKNFKAKGLAVESNGKLAICWGELKKLN